MGKIIQISRDETFNRESNAILDEIAALQNMISKIQQKQMHIEKRIAIPLSDGFEMLQFNDLVYCEASGNYTIIYLSDGSKRLISKTLKWLLLRLPEDLFIRTHHSFIVNINAIQRYFRGDCVLKLCHSDNMIPVSRRKKDMIEHIYST